MEFSGFLTYIDEETMLAYVEMKKNQNYEILMKDVNDYYAHIQNTEQFSKLQTETKKLLYSHEYCSLNFFSAKYHVDEQWYRAKFIRKIDENTVS
jgi:hypothetical protein